MKINKKILLKTLFGTLVIELMMIYCMFKIFEISKVWAVILAIVLVLLSKTLGYVNGNADALDYCKARIVHIEYVEKCKECKYEKED